MDRVKRLAEDPSLVRRYGLDAVLLAVVCIGVAVHQLAGAGWTWLFGGLALAVALYALVDTSAEDKD